MEEELINFKTAKLAKEKGFNIRVKPFYNGLQDNKLEVSDIIGSSNQLSNWYPAPTQSLLQKWLRDEHNIDVLVDKGFLSNKYSYEVLYKNDMLDSEYVFKTYEEALGKGLYEALKLI